MATADDIADGFLRYVDLQKLKIVSSRSDLHDKQRNLGFPLPIKPGRKVALFLRSEVIEWLLALVAKRDAEHEHRNACKLIEIASTAEGDAKRHAHLIAQGTTRDAKRDDKPRKGIQHQGTTVDKCTGRTA
jgi:predicted DNA-binding transcriptional regulator AlpA